MNSKANLKYKKKNIFMKLNKSLSSSFIIDYNKVIE